MKVGAILRQKGSRVVTVRPESKIDTVVHRMRLERIGAVVVSADGRTLAGVLSERDILRALAEHGAALLALTAADVVTRNVVTCGAEELVQSAMVKMTHGRFRHMPVIEGGRLAGIISIGDAVKSRLEEVELEANVLRDAFLAVH